LEQNVTCKLHDIKITKKIKKIKKIKNKEKLKLSTIAMEKIEAVE
jgi:hypothetical protein